MNLFMWYSPEKEIPEAEIIDENLAILKEALKDCMEFDIRTVEVYQALDYLEGKILKTWGVTLFREGLESFNLQALFEGYRLITVNIKNR